MKPPLITLAATFISASTLLADTTIATNTVQNGGTLSVTPPVLLVTGSGNPKLTLNHSATANWSPQGAIIVGNLTGESGQLEILGGSKLSIQGTFSSLGNYGTPNVSSGISYLGLNGGSSGSALVSGTGSSWTSNDSLYVGFFGKGTLDITEGGSVSNGAAFVGLSDTRESVATVSGKGSTWNNSGTLYIGHDGKGALSITDGASVSSSMAYLGRGTNGNGTAIISGKGSTWINGGDLIIGDRGSNNLVTITDGGMVKIGTQGRGSLRPSSSSGESNYLRLDGGFLALFGDQREKIGELVESSFFQYRDGDSWVTAELADLALSYFDATDTERLTALGYEDLVGYTIVGTEAIPEPSTYLLIGIGALALSRLRRRS